MGKLFDDPQGWAAKEPDLLGKKTEEQVDTNLENNHREFENLTVEVKVMSERVEKAAQALKDAAEAYKIAGVPAQSEDIRALAITFMIDEGKNGRVPIRATANNQPVAPVTKQDTTSVRREFFKPLPNQEYEVLVESYEGEISSGKYTSDKFLVTINGEPYIHTTSGKLATAYKNSTGKTGRLLQTKTNGYTNYSFKVAGVEQVAQRG